MHNAGMILGGRHPGIGLDWVRYMGGFHLSHGRGEGGSRSPPLAGSGGTRGGVIISMPTQQRARIRQQNKCTANYALAHTFALLRKDLNRAQRDDRRKRSGTTSARSFVPPAPLLHSQLPALRQHQENENTCAEALLREPPPAASAHRKRTFSTAQRTDDGDTSAATHTQQPRHRRRVEYSGDTGSHEKRNFGKFFMIKALFSFPFLCFTAFAPTDGRGRAESNVRLRRTIESKWPGPAGAGGVSPANLGGFPDPTLPCI